jgi:DNA polymerase III delta subunit
MTHPVFFEILCIPFQETGTQRSMSFYFICIGTNRKILSTFMAQFEKIQNSAQLMSAYRSKRPQGTFLLLGEERAEKEKCIDLFKKNFFIDKPNFQVFHCESDDFLRGAEFVLSGDMFSSEKAAVFKNIDAILKKKSNLSVLSDILAVASESVLVILEMTSNKAPATLTKLGIPFEAAIFWKKFESDLADYIVSALKKEGKTIDHSSTTLILALCGRNMAVIDDALKNIIFGTEQKSIGTEEIKHLIQDNRAVSIFECIDTLFQKDKNSISAIQRTIDNGTHELVIISMIFSRLVQMDNWFQMKKDGIPRSEILSSLSIAPKQHAFFETSVRKFSHRSVRDCLIQLQKTEKKLKSSATTKNILANHLMDLLYFLIK